MVGTGNLNEAQRALVHASKLAQTEYTRPDDLHMRRIRRFWWRKPKPFEEPTRTPEQLERAERQRRLMTGSDVPAAEPVEDEDSA